MRSPLAACVGVPFSASSAHVLKQLEISHYLRDEVGLTRSPGPVGAWTSESSVWAVVAESEKTSPPQ